VFGSYGRENAAGAWGRIITWKVCSGIRHSLTGTSMKGQTIEERNAELQRSRGLHTNFYFLKGHEIREPDVAWELRSKPLLGPRTKAANKMPRRSQNHPPLTPLLAAHAWKQCSSSSCRAGLRHCAPPGHVTHVRKHSNHGSQNPQKNLTKQ